MQRCLLVWLSTTMVATLTTDWVAPDLGAALAAARADGGLAQQPFDRIVVWLAAASLALCAAWGWAATTVVIAQALAGWPDSGGPAVPRWLRTAVLVTCGVAVVGTGGAAQADEDTARATEDHRQVLAGLPSPDRVIGSVPPAPATHTSRTHVVRPGDTLWDIAEAELGGGAQWQRIHALNRAVIGADPDLIHPGQELRLPTQELDR
jgi:nucleoid-associated protein YgaU